MRPRTSGGGSSPRAWCERTLRTDRPVSRASSSIVSAGHALQGTGVWCYITNVTSMVLHSSRHVMTLLAAKPAGGAALDQVAIATGAAMS